MWRKTNKHNSAINFPDFPVFYIVARVSAIPYQRALKPCWAVSVNLHVSIRVSLEILTIVVAGLHHWERRRVLRSCIIVLDAVVHFEIKIELEAGLQIRYIGTSKY